MRRVAIVILNYNGANYLRQFLPTVIKHSANAQIIVADNCSTDDSIELLISEFPSTRLIRIDKNLGFAGGYNKALTLVDAEYFVLLNSDVEVTRSWLDPMVTFLDQNKSYAAVQPKILDFHKKNLFEYAGAAGGFLDHWGYPYCRGRIFDTLEEDNGQYDTINNVFWCSGACLFIRSEDFHYVGGFDDDFFAHMEEIDLCWRLKNQGRQLACTPDSIIYHVGGGTLNKTSPFKTYLNFRNNLSMLLKNLSWLNVITIIPIRMILDLVAGMMLWKNLSFSHLKAIFRAHADFIKRIPKNIKKREATKLRVGRERNILFLYYLRKKRTFSTLNNTK